MPSFIRWLIGGAVGGVVGAAVWAAITYFTNHEIGWIAWGVGIASGFGVRAAAGDDEGNGPGLTAALIAVLALVGGKYTASTLLVNKVFGEIASQITLGPDQIKLDYAAEVAAEWEAAGKKLKWPKDSSLETAEAQAHFPPEVWKEAEKRWNDKSPDDQKKLLAEQEEGMVAIRDMIKGQAGWAAFQASFGPIDILFFLLAIASAWKLGSGSTGD